MRPRAALALLLLACGEPGSAGGSAGMSAVAGMSAGHSSVGGMAGAPASAGGSTMAMAGGGTKSIPSDVAGAGVGGQTMGGEPSTNPYPPQSETVAVLTRVNRQFANKWPSPATTLPGSRPSHIWTRAVYFEGLLALHEVAPRDEYRAYAEDWASFHEWSLRTDVTNADNQCAGQVYFELFQLDGSRDPSRLDAIRASLDTMLADAHADDWTWVDAIQMSMPLWASFAAYTGDARYLEKMHALYSHTKRTEGGGLWDEAAHLWWRDAKWKPSRESTPAGRAVYWSRGNGWVFAALARVLARLPPEAPHRDEYAADFRAMAAALVPLQRPDGFWNASLADADHFGGPETTGTALFTYGLAWGVRNDLLTEAEYGAAARRAWSGMLSEAVRADGFLGFVQSSGDDPSDGQPLSADKQPDFEDFGVGCFLLAGSQLVRLSAR